ncbi:GNAT family N-acetyltransferase [Brucepastera parasyntrophica]|uniref:GNAT family N-acetyltransferase n=1 Tax=Brucepastera parasyntrophica TaxID=2880008 RepID=UPI00210D821D|nr:GNAT family N-acetyltransferase [Brucepastera parasyntrophica]ULQ58772.1 GNAT family N-acetyltransferase [Brucepastera parasyntrophica]
MKQYNGLTFNIMRKEDIPELTAVMKRAFDEDSRRHLGEESGGPDGYDDGSFLRKWGLHPASSAWKIEKDGKLIGAVIVWVFSSRENKLGCMFIDPELQDKGLGRTVWKFIESEYPQTVTWRTETPGFSKRNHNFYVNKLGFKIVKIENPGDPRSEMYIMEKEMGRR